MMKMEKRGDTFLTHSLKRVLMSTGLLFITILILKLALTSHHPPLLIQLNLSTNSQLHHLWWLCKATLRPPYLYLLINAIIITIAATSRHHHYHNHHHFDVELLVMHPHPHPVVGMMEGDIHVVDDDHHHEVEEVEVGSTMPTSTPPPPQLPPLVRHKPVAAEKPPASLRFGQHRRPRSVKLSQAEGGKALRVAKPKKQETLESSWKAITEGRHIPLTRHLKKLDTWENHSRQINLLDNETMLVKKSETFKNRTNPMSPAVPLTKLKKEPSLSQDELNRRVEAFINKFNEEMRLQRQQSMQQFMEKINRAT